MFKSDILFAGYYGQKNTGDDAFVEVSAWGAEKYWGINNIKYLAKSQNLPITQSESVKGYPLTIPRGYRYQESILLRKTKYLISAGGSTIHSKMAASNIKNKAAMLKNKHPEKIKIGGIGISIGPFKTLEDERTIAEYLKTLDFLAVRDQASFDFASSLQLPYKPINAFDLAALLPEIYSSKKINEDVTLYEKKVVGISVCPYESISDRENIAKEESRKKMLVALLKELEKQADIRFKFLVINGNERNGDLELTQEIIALSELKDVQIIPYQKRTESMWDEIISCDFVISTRLHAAIFACFSGVPFMLNEYHRKCGDFLETVGYDNNYRLYNSKYDIHSKALQIIDVINMSTPQMATRINEMKEKALLNFTGVSL